MDRSRVCERESRKESHTSLVRIRMRNQRIVIFPMSIAIIKASGGCGCRLARRAAWLG